MPRRRRPRRLTRRSSSAVARNNSLIASKISDIEAALDRVGDRRRGIKPRRLSKSRGLKDLTKSLGTSDTNIHSLVEKAANLTSRWSKTASMVSLIGSNMKGIASPLLGNLGSLTGLLKRGGSSGAGGSLAGLAQAVGNAGASSSPSGGGGGGLDLGSLMQTAQNVLGQMSKPAGPTDNED